MLVCFSFRTQGCGCADAPGIPCALYWARIMQDSGGSRREIAEVWLVCVIASDSEAIQSGWLEILDCFVAYAPRNDEERESG